MTGVIATIPKFQFSNALGIPMSGGTLTVYLAGTTTPTNTWQDQALTSLNTNPINLDSRGECVLWLDSTVTYKFVLKNALGVTQWTVDNITNSAAFAQDLDTQLRADLAASSGSLLVGYMPADVGAVASTVQAKLRMIRTSSDNSNYGSRNTAVGAGNFTNGALGVENTTLGSDNLKALTTGYANVAVGIDVLSANTTGAFNMAVGVKTLYKNTTGSGNTAFGAYSTYENKTGSANTGFGEDTNRYVDGGNNNVAVGTQALYNNVTGVENTAIGTYAARNATNPPDDGAGTGPSPTYITAIGAYSLYVATGTFNTGVGHGAGYNTASSYNSYFGANAGAKNASGNNSVFVGYNAGNVLAQPTAAINSTGIGTETVAGTNATTIGHSAAAAGENGVAVGKSSNASALSSTAIGTTASVTGANSIAIGFGVAAGIPNVTAIGNLLNEGVYTYGGFYTQLDNTFDIGSAGGRFKTIYATTGTINTSDLREKQDIQNISVVEKRVAFALKGLIKKFKFRDAVTLKGDAARIHIGVIAQEVISAFSAEGLDAENYGILCYDEWESGVAVDGVSVITAGNRYGVRYEELLTFIISAL